MSDVICRGSFVLGSDCGQCRRCYREVQDAWLALHAVQYQISQFGEGGEIAGKGSPTFGDVSRFVLANWQSWFRDFIEDERRRGNA